MIRTTVCLGSKCGQLVGNVVSFGFVMRMLVRNVVSQLQDAYMYSTVSDVGSKRGQLRIRSVVQQYLGSKCSQLDGNVVSFGFMMRVLVRNAASFKMRTRTVACGYTGCWFEVWSASDERLRSAQQHVLVRNVVSFGYLFCKQITETCWIVA